MKRRQGEGSERIKITEKDLHPHLKARMQQRGVTLHEIERTLNEGWEATDAKLGTLGKVMVFPYHAEWEGKFHEEKEVTVYYKLWANKSCCSRSKQDMAKDLEVKGSED